MKDEESLKCDVDGHKMKWKQKSKDMIMGYGNQLQVFFKKHFYLFGNVLMVLGVFIGFFGNRFVDPLLAMTVAAAVGMILMEIVMAMIGTCIGNGAINAIFTVICVIGGLTGWYCQRFKHFRRISLNIMACGAGIGIGWMITNTFFVSGVAAYWILVILSALVSVFAFNYVQDVAILLVTSFIGSYFMIRGLSLYTGGFPAETLLHEMIRDKTYSWKTFPKVYYAYMVCIIVLTAFTFWFQRKQALKSSMNSEFVGSGTGIEFDNTSEQLSQQRET